MDGLRVSLSRGLTTAGGRGELELDDGRQMEEGEFDDATAAANAKASMSGAGGDGWTSTIWSELMVSMILPVGRTGESTPEACEMIEMEDIRGRGKGSRNSAEEKDAAGIQGERGR